MVMSESLFYQRRVSFATSVCAGRRRPRFDSPIPPLLTKGQSTWRFEASLTEHDPSTWLQGRDQRSKNPDAVLVRPVVEDPAKVIDVGAVDGLLGEHVMSHEAHSVRQLGWHLRLGIFDDVRKVLDDESKGRELPGNVLAH